MKYIRSIFPNIRMQFALLALCALFMTPLRSSVLINEFDYDNIGTDDSEFIELFNSSVSSQQMDGFRLDLHDYNTDSIYRSVDLSGFSVAAGGFFVVCGNSLLVMNCDLDISPNSNFIQNGEADAILLYSGTSLIDAIAYEALNVNFEGKNNYTEGDLLSTVDSNVVTMSISRALDGVETGSDDEDFHSGCITPGTANIGGTGNCSTSVPTPSVALLLSTGLISLIGFTRKKKRS